MQRRLERYGGEIVAVAEDVDQCPGDERVADAASGELEGGVGVLDLDARPNRDPGALGALGELAAGWVFVAPAGFGPTRTASASFSMVIAPSSRAGSAHA